MIRVDAAIDEAGLLISCSVDGHAGAGPRGGDVVCAAVSVLAGTALRVLSKMEGVTVRGGAPERGAFRIETGCDERGASGLSAVGTFLLEGLQSVAGEYPNHCSVKLRTERRQQHGS